LLTCCFILTNALSIDSPPRAVLEAESPSESFDGDNSEVMSSEQVGALHNFLLKDGSNSAVACRKCRQFKQFGWMADAMCGYSGFCSRRRRQRRRRNSRCRRNDACLTCTCPGGVAGISKKCAYGEFNCESCGTGKFVLTMARNGLKVCVATVAGAGGGGGTEVAQVGDVPHDEEEEAKDNQPHDEEDELEKEQDERDEIEIEHEEEEEEEHGDEEEDEDEDHDNEDGHHDG